MPVAFHINDNHKWQDLENNIAHLLTTGYTDKIVVVATDDAVTHFYDLTHLWYIERTAGHIKWMVCNDTLEAKDIDASQLPPFIFIVPNGIKELLNRQVVGYGYIKI